jgi:hypothetical protein
VSAGESTDPRGEILITQRPQVPILSLLPRENGPSEIIWQADVFDAVAQLVAAGEYLDSIPGRPGAPSRHLG